MGHAASAGIMRWDANRHVRPSAPHLLVGRRPCDPRRRQHGKGPRGPAYRAVRRATLTTLAVAIGMLALVAGVAFGLQAVTLGRQDRERLLVAATVGGLNAYHAANAVVTIGGHTFAERCTQTWVHRVRSDTVVGGGEVLRELRNVLVHSGPVAVERFELAGCPRSLGAWIAMQLNHGGPLVVTPVRFAGKRLLLVSFPGSQMKLQLIVRRLGGLPVGLRFAGRTVHGQSRVSYPRAHALVPVAWRRGGSAGDVA